MAEKLPQPGDIVLRKYVDANNDSGDETPYLVLAARVDPTERVWSILVPTTADGGPGWVLWQPKEGQWRLRP